MKLIARPALPLPSAEIILSCSALQSLGIVQPLDFVQQLRHSLRKENVRKGRSNRTSLGETVCQAAYRKAKAMKDKRCLKCLAKGHATTECKAEWKCKHCKNKDHRPSLCHAKYGMEKTVSFVPTTKKAKLLTVTDKPTNLSAEASNVLALT